MWTERAIQGYDKIIRYLEQHWTEKEVRNFIHESNEFFTLLSLYPQLLQKTNRSKNVYRAPMNKLTIIVYRVKMRTFAVPNKDHWGRIIGIESNRWLKN